VAYLDDKEAAKWFEERWPRPDG